MERASILYTYIYTDIQPKKAGEVERITIEDFKTYQSIDDNDDPDLFNSLSADYQQSAKNYIRCVIRGKKARGVPVLLSKFQFHCAQLILKFRTEAGVAENNPYLFGVPGKLTQTHLRACDLMRSSVVTLTICLVLQTLFLIVAELSRLNQNENFVLMEDLPQTEPNDSWCNTSETQYGRNRCEQEQDKENDENLINPVLKVFNENLNISCHENDIRDLHRIGRKITEERPRPITIEVMNYKLKNEILNNARKLKSTGLYLTREYSSDEYQGRTFLFGQLKIAKEKYPESNIKNNTLIVNGEKYTRKQLEEISIDTRLNIKQGQANLPLDSTGDTHNNPRAVNRIRQKFSETLPKDKKKQLKLKELFTEAASDFFKEHIIAGDLPSMVECSKIIEANPALQNRTPTQLKAWVANQMKRKTNKPSNNPDNLKRALFEIQEGRMSVRMASREFGVRKTTLQDHKSGKVPQVPKKTCPQSLLTIEGEKKLVDWVINLAECGFPVKKLDLLETRWYSNFLKRHPIISLREAESVNKAHAIISEEGIRAWFCDLKKYLLNTKNEDILEDPDRILNGDEAGFSLDPKTGKVLAPRG
ncbi:hypothetical protein NQ314_007518 [Rhamnusium bicolor]|uniref:HTH psq-type domain-containing protein n=1 Tax=Rhamnusium bicolor TaxID=1586634 RepID=A0AAV8YLJ0_9CUCU|nr:hypothetical protein NQ314_007518 [Rhamnusium bicolor]